MTKTEAIVHTVTFLALLAAYVALTIAGHDASLLLGALIGQGAGAGLTAAMGKAGASG